jgi:hypothetical protein
VDLVFLASSLALSVWIMAARFSLFRRISVVGAVFLAFLVMHGLSAIPYAAGMIDRSPLLSGPVHEDFPYVLGASFLFFAVGAVLTARAFHFELPQLQRAFFGQKPDPAPPRMVGFLVLIGMAIGLALLFTFGAGRTGWELLAEEARNERVLREFRLAYVDENPFYYVGSYAKNLLLPVAMLTALNLAAFGGRRRWAAAGWGLFGMLLLTSIANLHKLPVIIALLFVLLNRSLRTSRNEITGFRPLLLPGVIILLVGPILYFVTYDLTGQDAFAATLTRIMVVPQACLEGFLHVYPSKLPFNHGLGIGLVSKLLGSRSYVSPPFAVGEYISGDPNVSANAFWSSEMWAAFGYAGVVLGSMFTAGFLVSLDALMLRRRRTAMSAATYAYLVVASLAVPSVSILTAMLSGGLALAPLLLTLLDAPGTAASDPDALAAAGPPAEA